MKRFLIILFVLLAFNSVLSAKIILPSVFADHMVLQQNSEVAIWNWSDPGETVIIVASRNTTSV